MNAIEVKDLSKRYKGFELSNLSLNLPAGCILGLVGENGAGKSTTISLLMNAVPKDSGDIRVLGVDPASKEFKETREDIGVVLDEANFPEVLTALEVNKMMRQTYKNWDEEHYKKFLAYFKLPEKKMFKDFSKGMKMKLAIAVALSHDPKLLILDEATSGLDPMVRDEILDIFNDFTRQENHSILMSSHIISDLEKICDYVAFIHQGKLLICEEKDRLKESYGILHITKADLGQIPKEIIAGTREGNYGVELLVKKSEFSSAFEMEPASIEDIILFLAREERKL